MAIELKSRNNYWKLSLEEEVTTEMIPERLGSYQRLFDWVS